MEKLLFDLAAEGGVPAIVLLAIGLFLYAHMKAEKKSGKGDQLAMIRAEVNDLRERVAHLEGWRKGLG